MFPKISVIIPVYNAEETIEKCIDSVRCSRLKDIEIICVDDGSTDNSLKILYDLQKRDNRIKVLYQRNSYAGVARNNGLKAATGKYVHFLDADDWIECNTYETLYSTIENDESDVCICCYKTVDMITGKIEYMNKNIIRDNKKISNIINEPNTFLCGVVVPWNKLYRRGFLVDNQIYFDELICANDRGFYFEVILKAKKITLIKEYLVNHVINNSKSLVGETRLKNFDVHFKSFNRIWNLYSNQDNEVKKLILQQCIGDCMSFYRKSKKTKYEKINRMKMLCFLANLNIGLFEENIKEFYFYDEYLEIFRRGLPKSVLEGLKYDSVDILVKKSNLKRTVEFYNRNGFIETFKRILKELKM